MNGFRSRLGKSARKALLAAVAVSVWTAAGEAGPGPMEAGPHGSAGLKGSGMDFFNPHMLKELHLAPDQEKKFREQRMAFQKKKIQLQSDKAILELDLKEILAAYPVNQAAALKTGEKIGELEKKTFLLKVESWSRFLSQLSAEQHGKLLDFQAEMREKRRRWKEEKQEDGKGRH